ncbi:MAG: CoA transferase [Bacteroidota bacterium]
MRKINQLFQSLPIRFRPEKAGNLNIIVHFVLKDIKDTHKFSVKIHDSKVEVNEGISGDANCIVKSNVSTYIKLETGEINPQLALLTGKVKVSDINEMLRFTKCFRKYKKQEGSHILKKAEKKISRPEKVGPLTGVRILDLSRLLPGPMATQMLGQMGAEVIKIEDPENGDPIRSYPPVENGESLYYLALNRSKRSVALDLYSEEDKNILLSLVEKSDVLIEQFRPGVMKALNLDYDSLKKINPKLIMISLSGYGQFGELYSRAGHDINYMATSGVLDLNRDADGKPVVPDFQLADIAGGSYMLLTAVTTALYSVKNTGEGLHIDLSMTDALLPFTTMSFTRKSRENDIGLYKKAPLSGGLANYDVYKTKDGGWMALGALEPKFWNTFCDAVGKKKWKAYLLPEEAHKHGLKTQVIELFLRKTKAEWTEISKKYDMCLTPVSTLEDVLNNNHFLERGAIFKDTDEETLLNFPIKFGKLDLGVNSWKAPLLDEDNVLEEFGIKKEENDL